MTGYERLTIAILQQAVKDYQTALRKKDTGGIAYLEYWFVSDYGQLLSGDKGELITAKCRERVTAKECPNRLIYTPAQRKRKEKTR